MWATSLRRSTLPQTVLTTVDENKDLEAYIYIPTERAGQVRQGLDVELMDNSGKLIEKTKIDFLSAQVDSTLQGILVKAPVHATPEMLRNAQMVKARVIWSTSPMAVVPVLAVTRQGGQSFRLCGAGSRTDTLWPVRLRSRWAIPWATTTPSPRG